MDEKYKNIYKEAVDYLYSIKPKEISNEQLDRYFFVEGRYNSKNEVLERLLSSLQNYQRMPNVIKFFDNREQFKKILFDFDCDKILREYKDSNELLNAFVKKFSLDSSSFNRKNNSLVKYSKAVISACSFVSQFTNVNDFDKFVNLFSYNETTSAALPMLLSKEIYGLGFALGCDFLKELGYSQYPKPDIHLIDIFSELNLSDRNEYHCYKAIIKMARIVGETPYKVDKVFWLISSGNYYHEKITGPRYKNEFINYIKEKYKYQEL